MRSMVQPDQNMMIPELSGIHVHFSFEVSSYSGQAVPKCVLTADFAKAVRDRPPEFLKMKIF